MQPLRLWLTVSPMPIFSGSNGGNFYGPLLPLDDIDHSAGTSATSAKSKHTSTRAYTWFFSLAARCHCNPALSYVSLSTFLDIINTEYCKAMQAHSYRQTSRSGGQINHHFFDQHRGGQHLPCGKRSRYTNLWVHRHRKTDVGQCGARLVAAPRHLQP